MSGILFIAGSSSKQAALKISRPQIHFFKSSRSLVQFRCADANSRLSINCSNTLDKSKKRKGAVEEGSNYALNCSHVDDEQRLLVKEIKHMLQTLTTGNISPSAYDTAWVARIASPSDSSAPEFPKALDWIVKNQLEDGSWGDRTFFHLYDRVLNTLACLITLKMWNIANNNIEKGIKFLRNNMRDLKEDNGDLLSGFEVTFPVMIQEAKHYNLDIPYDLPYIAHVKRATEKKMQKIPLEVLHSTPTTLLYSLEGLQEHIDWNKILALQSKDGSFLSSPSSTACVYMHTKEHTCLKYLRNAMESQNYAVPCHFPIDLFERLWVVDTIERLGIDGFFREEIKNILDYVYERWDSDKGIGWATTCLLSDIDDTAMAFRILRLHGYDVSADVLKNFKARDKFFCFPGELGHGVTEMLNLHRASQVAFPKEDILDEARAYSHEYLSKATTRHLDKWANKKDIMGEIKFELENTWWTTLPRMYADAYIKQYGENDVWIAKTLYRLYAVNNELLLKLANSYTKQLHSYHASEVGEIVRWWDRKKLSEIPSTRLKVNKDMIPYIYWVIASCMYDEKFHTLRLYFVKIGSLNTLFDDLMDSATDIAEVDSLLNAVKSWGDPSAIESMPLKYQIPFTVLVESLEEMAFVAAKSQMYISKDTIHKFLIRNYSRLIESTALDAKWKIQMYVPNFKEYMVNAEISITVWCHVLVIMFFCGEQLTEEILDSIYEMKCVKLNKVVSRLCNDIATYEIELKLGQVATGVNCYMKDKQGTSVEEAVKCLKTMLAESWKEMTQEYLKPTNNLPKTIHHFNFEMVRMMLLTYTRQGDIFREPTPELTDMLNGMLKASVPDIQAECFTAK